MIFDRQVFSAGCQIQLLSSGFGCFGTTVETWQTQWDLEKLDACRERVPPRDSPLKPQLISLTFLFVYRLNKQDISESVNFRSDYRHIFTLQKEPGYLHRFLLCHSCFIDKAEHILTPARNLTHIYHSEKEEYIPKYWTFNSHPWILKKMPTSKNL